MLYNAFSHFIFQSPYEGRIYNVMIICGEKYPEERPFVKFMTKIKLSCVQENGEVSTIAPDGEGSEIILIFH